MSEDSEVDFWLDSRQPGQFAEVMVSPRSQAAVQEWLIERNLRFRITINDVEKLIHQQEHSFKPSKKISTSTERINPLTSSSLSSASSSASYENDVQLQKIQRLRDSPMMNEKNIFGDRPFEEIYQLKGFNYPFGEYTNYATMLRFMRTIEFYYPHLAKIIRIGTTHEGRPIEGLKIGYHVSNSTKRAFWIDGNIHAREWASSHTALFIINQLIGGYGKDPTITHYMNNLNFLIIPCLNSDGYEYSRSSFSPDIRLWRKNRSPEKCANSVWGGLRCCQGVDLNRNFNFYWAQTGASTNPCSSIFAGDKAFSEPETKAVNDFLMSDEFRFKLDGFITIHSYGQLFIHPYSHEVEYYPNDIRKLENVAKKAVEKLRNVYGTQYRIGTGADLLSPASGGSDDWAKESLDTKYVYLIELRPQLELSRGFILNQEELIPTVIETFEGIKAVIEAVLEDNGIIPRPMIPRRSKEHSSAARIHSVPSAPMSNENKFVNGRFGEQAETELSPFRAKQKLL
uniref:Peptidase M14 carboxypeptidase A domain-containing protein n=1 Tax=Panagrolaimus superbus TaxID=310955 RepID=A0A914ZBR2_9BILA